jgi:hypothetical protein
MGNHLINSVTPAITEGEQFTHTWFCGACSGMIAFSEPVITLAYLQVLRNDDWGDIAVPKATAEPSYDPLPYCMCCPAANEDTGSEAYATFRCSLLETPRAHRGHQSTQRAAV